MGTKFDVNIVGAGPNGLTAGIVLAAHGMSVRIYELDKEPGGGLRTLPLTLPGFQHDHCSGVHPMGFLSPIFRQLKLEDCGLEWIQPDYSAAHPMDEGPAGMLQKSIDATASSLGSDADRYRSIFNSLHQNFERLLSDVLQPPSIEKSFLNLARFGMHALWPAKSWANSIFHEENTKALFAGCAAHSILPLEKYGTAAVGLIFLLAGHAVNWPIAKGGSSSIAKALVKRLHQQGGAITCNTRITRLSDLPAARATVFDLSPTQLSQIAGEDLPKRYLKALSRYVYGPSVFKIDYALSGAVPWGDPNCAKASTVHLGGTLDEIAASERDAWNGIKSEAPFVMFCQQSNFDSSRAPEGKQTGYAYCHVPYNSDLDYTKAIERQIERFAPGFQDCIIQRHTTSPRGFQSYNPANQGGTITGGATTLRQIFFRPTISLDPYSTPNPNIYLCSHATPPGGGVHGMCGFNAARSVLKNLRIEYDESKLDFVSESA